MKAPVNWANILGLVVLSAFAALALLLGAFGVSWVFERLVGLGIFLEGLFGTYASMAMVWAIVTAPVYLVLSWLFRVA